MVIKVIMIEIDTNIINISSVLSRLVMLPIQLICLNIQKKNVGCAILHNLKCLWPVGGSIISNWVDYTSVLPPLAD